MLNNNIFNVSNPVHMIDALWQFIEPHKEDLSKVLVFLPSVRAIKNIERTIIAKTGKYALPKLVLLGSSVENCEETKELNIISNIERVILLAKILSVDTSIKNISMSLPIAHELVRMQDYLKNEGVDLCSINWSDLIGDDYSKHFQNKAKILDIVKQLPTDKITALEKKNAETLAWKREFSNYNKIIVCGSTASVPSTAELMKEVANNPNGVIILPGKINGSEEDLLLDTNPYNSEYKFLLDIGADIKDIKTIDFGESNIDSFNTAFSNEYNPHKTVLDNCFLIECGRETEEVNCVLEIIKQASLDKKSVLVVTSDASTNYRLQIELKNNSIEVDSSIGVSGLTTDVSRSILNLFDYWIDKKQSEFDNLYKQSNYNIYDMLISFIKSEQEYVLEPGFIMEDEVSITILDRIQKMSEVLYRNNIVLNVYDARAFIKDAISSISIIEKVKDNCNVHVLDPIDARMQTADVVVIMGLNEGVFPSIGYKNDWLPIDIAQKIGLPSPNRKVSLMALDFMTLSCCDKVFWIRSKQKDGSLTTESRFLSRVNVANGGIKIDYSILKVVQSKDDVEYNPLSYDAPVCSIGNNNLYVTDIELLIHNPYAFYAKYILKLNPLDDYWIMPDARDFGILVHNVIENAKDFSADSLVAEMDKLALQKLSSESIVFCFWHKRFCDIAKILEQYFKEKTAGEAETFGCVNIAGHNVCAKADRIWDGVVMDVKTGSAPSKKQLLEGTMPQLPLEGYILQNSGFKSYKSDISKTPILQFLQLQNKHIKVVEFKDTEAQSMIDNTVQKVKELIGQYSRPDASYEYRNTQGAKYHRWDDLARADEL
ncbi:MAG: PD-(D/E)XK nuclease family protein [Alphaproteobacteria bacterium]|nr:PD-(D/E)XK nuclease family protein [Alphaproteobacteria bacterium]